MLSSLVVMGIFATAIPFIIKYTFTNIESILRPTYYILNQDAIKKFNEMQQNKNIHPFFANLIPVGVTVLGVFTTMRVGTPWGWAQEFYKPAYTSFMVFVTVTFLIIGALGWIFIYAIILLHNISSLNFIADIFEWPARHIKALISAIFSLYFTGVMVYLGAIATVSIIPWGVFLLTTGFISQYWIIPLALTVIIYFIICQYYLHRILVTVKEIRLEKLDGQLADLFRNKAKISESKLKLMSELTSWRKTIENEPVWPINISTSIGIIGGVLIPAIINIIDIVQRFFSK